jgi:anti-sigma regulatory factor (Ser/Thr protein kinase)
MSNEVLLLLPATAAAAAAARRLVTRSLGRWHLADRTDDVLIITTELVENVIKHTNAGGQLRLCLHQGRLLIEVTDYSTVLPHVREVDSNGFGGRGLRMVQTVATRWGARPSGSGKVVWAELATTPA